VLACQGKTIGGKAEVKADAPKSQARVLSFIVFRQPLFFINLPAKIFRQPSRLLNKNS